MLVHGSFFCGLLIPITFFPKLFRLRLQEPSNLENVCTYRRSFSKTSFSLNGFPVDLMTY